MIQFAFGEKVLDESFEVIKVLRFPVYRARQVSDTENKTFLLSASFESKQSLAQLTQELALPFAKICPIAYLGFLEKGSKRVLLIEEEPKGFNSSRLLEHPVSFSNAVRLSISLANIMLPLHRLGIALSLSCPEEVYLEKTNEGLSITGVTPRAYRFCASEELSQVVYNPPPPPARPLSVLLTPELAKGSSISPASDIFSLCLLLLGWSTGKDPFYHENHMTWIQAVLQGNYRLLEAPPALEGIIRLGFSKENRPDLPTFISLLENVLPTLKNLEEET